MSWLNKRWCGVALGLSVCLVQAMAMPIAVAADSGRGDWTHAELAAVANTIEEAMPHVPLSEPVATWIRQARIANHWTYANAATYREISTPEEAAARAQAIKDAGFNAVLISGRHFRQSYNDPDGVSEVEEQIYRNARLAVEACHALGLKVLDHHDFTLFYAGGHDVVFEHPEWLQMSVRFGQPLWRYYCPNDPGVVQAATDYIRKFQKRTGVDGYMIDEISFRRGSCGCEDCRAQFKEVTGYELPEFSASPVLMNRDNPLWRVWRQWRELALARYMATLIEAAQEINPDAVLLTYSTAFPQPSINRTGNDVFSRANVARFTGFEGTNIVYPGTVALMSILNLRLEVANAHGGFSWSQLPARSEEESAFGIFLAAATGQAPWSPGGPLVSEILNWPQWERVTWPRQPVADVGLVFSLSTRDAGSQVPAYLHMREHLGWGQTLVHQGVMYRPIFDQAGEQAEWSNYAAVILPASEALPIELNRLLVAYAQQGGTVIATGPVGFRGIFGLERSSSELAQVVGLQSIQPPNGLRLGRRNVVAGGSPVTLSITDAGRQVLGIDAEKLTLEEGLAYASQYDLPAEARVLATFVDGSPAIVEAPIGRGRVIHLSFLPGRATWQPKARTGMKIEAWVDPQARTLIAGLIDSVEAHPDSVPLTRIEAEGGQGVIGSILRDGDRAVVHLLNVGGLAPRTPGSEAIGTTITKASAVPSYPEVGPIQITLSLPNVQQAQWLSMDGGEVALNVQHNQQGTVIHVPAGALKRYAAIELLLGEQE